MNHPAVSILIPAYNAKYFPHALQSALGQTFTDIEIIIGDDCPTEEIQELVQVYCQSDKRIRYFRNEPPLGAYGNYLRCYDAAQGAFIKFLNDDDRLLPNCVERMVHCLQQYPCVTLVTSHRQCIGADGQPLADIEPTRALVTADAIINGVALGNKILRKAVNYIGEPSTAMFRKQDFRDVTPNIFSFAGEPITWNVDVVMWLTLLQKGDAIYLVDSLSEYRLHEDQQQRQPGATQKGVQAWRKLRASAEAAGLFQTGSDMPLIAHPLETVPKRVKGYQGQENQKRSDVGPTAHSAKSISIVIPVFNQVHYTRTCLQTVFDTTPARHCEVIVVDNGSTDETAAFLESQKDKITVITNATNMGFAHGCNQGARAASGDHIVFLNNDTEPQSGWLLEMLKVFRDEPSAGIVGNKLIYPDGTIQHAGVVLVKDEILGLDLNPWHVGHRSQDIEDYNALRRFPAVTAACMAIKKDLFERVGGFDEAYWNGYEDVDLCLKVTQSGVDIFYQPQSVVVHYESKSGPERRVKEDQNLRLLQKKWQDKMTPDFIRLPNSKIIPYDFASIVILTYNSQKTIETCLQSVAATLRPYDEVVIVDNASRDGTIDIVKRFISGRSQFKLIQNAENIGFSAGTNVGVVNTSNPYVVLLNPDTVVSSHWLERLCQHFCYPQVAAVGPVSNYVAAKQKAELYLGHRFTNQQSVETYAAKVYAANPGKGVSTKLLIGFCVMLNRKVFESIGMLDEALFLGNDDLDLSWRLREQGYQLRVAADTFVYHKGQESFNSEPPSKTKRLVQDSTDALYRKLVQHYAPDPVPSAEELWGISWFHPSPALLQAEALVSIVILAHNELEYTRKCVASVLTHTAVPFELIMVDNGSSDGTPEYLTRLKQRFSAQALSVDDPPNHRCRGVQVIRFDDNRGFAAGNNAGIAAAQGAYVLLMNNDVVVTPGWLARMLACLEAHPKAGIAGPRSNNVSGPQRVDQVDYDQQSLDGLLHFAQKLAGVNANHAQRLLRVVGFCMLIRREVIERIGGLDDRYGLGNFEDDDFSLRAALAGYESWMAQDAFVHHFGSRTFIGAQIDYRKSLHRNWEIFKQKWDQPPELAYGTPYDVTHILDKGFDPQQHYVPLPEASNDKRTRAEEDPGVVQGPAQVVAQTPPATNTADVAAQNPGSDVTIVLSLSNSLKRVRRSIESLQAHTPQAYEIVMIDAGASKAVRKWAQRAVRKDGRLRCIHLKPQDHLARGLNQAMQASTAEYIVWMHNDVQVFEGWYDALTQCWRIHPTTALVGPVTTAGCEPPQRYVYGAVAAKDFAGTSRENSEANRHRYLPAGHLAGFMLCGRLQQLMQLGEIDTQFRDERFWVKDWCLRAALEGMPIMIAAGALVQHHDRHPPEKAAGKGKQEDTPEAGRFHAKWRGIDIQSPTGRKLLVHKAVQSATRLCQQDNLDMAVDTLLGGIGHVPQDQRLYLCLVQMLVDAQQYQQALEVLQEMPAGASTEQMLVLKGYCYEGLQLYDKATEMVSAVLQRNPHQPAALNLKGVLAFHRGDRDAARQLLRQALEHNPALAEAYTNLGSLAWEQGDHETALSLFEKGFQMDATAGASMRMYHMATAASGQWERASVIFGEAAHQFPYHKRIAFLWIDTLVQQARHAEAMTATEATMARFGVDDEFLTAAAALRSKLGPMRLPEAAADQNRVSLCMIVKNEAEHLATCLHSLKPMVDELIVVDTGSEDQTQAIAEIFGARVYDFEWNNDFAAARNFSLAQAKGDWILVMDADEVIAPADHGRLRQMLRRTKGKAAAFTITTRNYFDHANITGWVANQLTYPEQEQGSGWVPSRKVRLFVNDKRIRFEKPVHELVEPSLQRCGIPIKTCQVPVHHYGKLNATKTDAKGEAYLRLGEVKLAEKSDDLKALEELAMQTLELGQHSKAIALWQRIIEIKPDSAMAHLHMSSSMLQLEAYEAAREASAQALALRPGLKEAVLNHSLSELCVGDVHRAIEELEALLAQVPDYPPAIGVLATAYCVVDNTPKALALLGQIKTLGYDCAAYLSKRAQRLMGVERHAEAVKILQAAVEGGYVNQDVLGLLGMAYKGSGLKHAGGVSQHVSAV